MPIDATIVLPMKNGVRYLAELFAAVFAQTTHYTYEFIAVDSGSTDGSLELVTQYPIRLIQIAPHTFNHGETRNLGASYADPTSRYILFLTQDATPMEGWLDALLDPLEHDPNLAGTFSRHVPRADCQLPLARRMTTEWEQAGMLTPIHKQITDLHAFEQHKAFYCYFSNTSSALRRSVFAAYPFRRVEFAEDADWAERVLRAGYSLRYQPASRVLHSHSYPLWDQFTQNVDHAKGMRVLLGPQAIPTMTWERFWHQWKEATRLDFLYAGLFPMRTRDRLIWIFYSSLWEFATLSGSVVGFQYHQLPKGVVRLLSHQRRVRRGKAQAGQKAVQPGPSPFISRSGR